MNNWISVEDKPVPDDDVRYIVFAHYHEKSQVECTKGWAVGTNVTHWMPLPTPPGESPKKTNGDRIRAMSDEELAKLLEGPYGNMEPGTALKWLKEDAT